jgi:hypothetical protein
VACTTCGTAEHSSPVAETEFAQDASFGFRNSELARYVEEKSSGRFRAAEVIVLDLNIIRGGADLKAGAVAGATDSKPIVVDAVTENDLRALALGLAEAESRGKKLLYRVGPPFVRACAPARDEWGRWRPRARRALATTGVEPGEFAACPVVAAMLVWREEASADRVGRRSQSVLLRRRLDLPG